MIPTTARVTVASDSPAISCTGLLGPNGAVPTDGYGGWEVNARPRRKGLPLWNGRNPFELTLQIVFDKQVTDGTVEGDCDALERMALPISVGSEPPVVSVSSPGGAVPHDDLLWVINGIQWEDVERDERGLRTRQIVTAKLLEFVDDSRLHETSASSRARGRAGGGNAPDTWTVGTGDTLKSIAQEIWGDASRWTSIADLNDIRDPDHLTIGQILLIP